MFVLIVSSLAVFGCRIDPVNTQPDVNAGQDDTVTVNQQTALQGTVTDDGLPADGELEIGWSVVSGQQSAVEFSDASSPTSNVVFHEIGNYVLELFATDGDLSNSDDVAISVYSGNSNDVGIWKSVSEGYLDAPMKIENNLAFSEISYDGKISFDLNIPVQGEYMLRMKVLAINTGSDSFYVGLDNENVFSNDEYVWDIKNSNVIIQDLVSLRGETGGPEYAEFDPMVWNLDAGTHTFTFFVRESNAKLSEVMIDYYSESEPTCDDGKQNGEETGVDCGGHCPECPVVISTADVYITSPSDGEKIIVNKPIYLRADKLGSKSITKVEFFEGNTKLGEDTSAPFEYFYKKSSTGNYVVTTKAHTSSNEIIEDSVSFSIIPQPADPSYCIKNGKDECAELFEYSDKEYQRTFKYYCYDPNNEGLNWDGIGWGEGYRLQGLASAYEAFNDKIYLEKMVRDMNAMFCIDEGVSENNCILNGKEECGYTYQGWGATPEKTQKEWGWYGDSYGTEGVYFDCFVCEGIMMQGMTKFIEFVKLNPELESEEYGTYDYKQLADKYLKEIEYLYDKWERRGLFKEVGDGSGVYVYYDDNNVQNSHPRMALPHNQQVEWAGAMLTLYRITGDVKYRDRAAKVLYHLKKNYYIEDGVVNWNYWDHSGIWDYSYDESQESSGGLEHWEGEEHKMGYKRISSSAMVEGWKNCLVFDDEDIEGAMQRDELFGQIPRDDYGTLWIPLFGYYDSDYTQTVFEYLSNLDDNPNQWDYAPTTRFKLISGQFWAELKNQNPKYYVCNVKEIPIYQTFNGATIDFKNVEDITSVSNVVLEKTGKGKIEFKNEDTDMANLFLDAYVLIDYNFVRIFEDEIPELNVPATVTLYNVEDNNPVILKDNSICSNCNIVSSGNNVKFTIPGAGVYKVAEKKSLLFKDDFESGDFSKWTRQNTKGKLAITSSEKRSGSKSLEVSFGDQVEMYLETQDFNVKDYIYKVSFMLSDDFRLKTSKYDRSFNFGTNPTTENGKNILMIDYKRGADIGVEEWSYANHIYLQYSDNNGWEHWVPQNRMKGPVLENKKWYDIEYHFVSDPNGYVDVYLDGKFIGRSTIGDTSESEQKSFRLGVMPEAIWSGTAQGKIYYDNLEVYKIN